MRARYIYFIMLGRFIFYIYLYIPKKVLLKRKYPMKRMTLLLLGILTLGLNCPAQNYTMNRAPLTAKTYTQLPIGSIKAQGWLNEQLHRMSTGLTGHLDEIYPEVVGARNAWLGGDGDAWERGPYWIDGLLPLAYILNDDGLKQKVQPWIDHILASQQPNGQFGPLVDLPGEPGLQRDNAQDWWPRMVVLKILQQYYSATGDKRVINFLTNYFHYQLAELPQKPLGNWTFWGEQRGGDNLQVVLWLYNITGDSSLLELGELIHRQTVNWTDIFLNQDHLQRQLSLHCVNLGQGFKEPVVYYQLGKSPQQLAAVKKAVSTIRNTIGLPTGLWGGDELLRFGEPTTGSEFCTATEMMFSLESMLEITGDRQWADYLERVAYNALPTQATDDFDARQYYQQNNQVKATLDWRNFSTPHDDTDILFGVLNGYPCCTCNMHQGWPKLVQNLWYATADRGAAALVYAPSAVSIKVADGQEISIEESTSYPFGERIDFIVKMDKKMKQIGFPFHLRIPEWCEEAVIQVNGETIEADVKDGIAVIRRDWKNGDKLSLQLPMKLRASQWYGGGGVVERGPLIYALKMNEQWTKKQFDKQRGYGDWYYEVTSDSPWNYGLRRDILRHPENFFSVEEKSLASTSYPWNVENAPITLKGKGLRMKDWEISRGSAGPISYYTEQAIDYDGEEDIELIPYGCTTLRITVFPLRR